MSQMLDSTTEDTHRTRLMHWLLVAILGLAFLRGVYNLGHDSLWWDESLSHYRATHDVPFILSNRIVLEDGINQVVTTDNHPPLYFLILHFAVRLMGDSEFALRFPSLAFAVLCVALLYAWGKRMFGPEAGLLSALMGACSPLYLWYAQEARPYTAVTFWGLLAMVTLMRALETRERRGIRWWITYACSTAAMIWTHYLSFLLLPVHGAIVVLHAARGGRWKQIALPAILTLLIALPILIYGLYAMPKQPMAGYRFIPLRDLLRDLADSMGPGLTAASTLPRWLLWTERVIFLGCALVLCIHAGRQRFTIREGQHVLTLLAYLGLPVVIMYALSYVRPAYMNIRHLMFISPAFYTILGAGMATVLKAKWLRMGKTVAVAALAVLLMGMGWGSEQYFRNEKFEKDDHRAWGAYLRTHAQPGDCIVVNPAQIAHLYSYYADAGWPWVGLPLLNASPEQTEAVLTELAANYERIWLASSFTPHWGDPERIPRRWLQSHLPEVDFIPFHTYASIVEIRAFSTHQPFSATRPSPQYPLEVEFGGQVSLLGYDLPGNPPTAGRPLRYVLYWEVLTGHPSDYHFSLALHDGEGLQWGKADQPLLLEVSSAPNGKTIEESSTLHTHSRHRAFLPLTLQNWNGREWTWTPTQYVRTEGELAIEPGAPPGEYRLELTAYNPSGLMPHSKGKSLTLTTFRVRQPSTPPTLADLPLEHRIGRRFGAVELMGNSLWDGTVLPGEWALIRIFWRAVQPPQANYEFVLRLIGPDGSVWNEKTIPPVHGYPTERWQTGEVVQGKHGIRVPPDAPAGRYRLEIVQVSPEPGTWAQVWRRDRVTLGSVLVAERERLFTVPEVQYRVNANLGDVVTLLGYDLSPTTIYPGDALTLTLYWQCRQQMPTNYTVFVHVIDEEGKVPVQRDAWPREWAYPTELWVPGEVIDDVYHLTLPTDAPPGEYTIAVGMFNADTGERLPVTLADGQQVPERWIILQKVWIEPQ